MRRIPAILAAGVLVLVISGPAVAVPIGNSQTMPYDISCQGGQVTWSVNANGVPGWDQDWGPGDVPYLLLGYTVEFDGGSFTNAPPPGLVMHGRLYGPCTITGDGWDPGWWITGGWFLIR